MCHIEVSKYTDAANSFLAECYLFCHRDADIVCKKNGSKRMWRTDPQHFIAGSTMGVAGFASAVISVTH